MTTNVGNADRVIRWLIGAALILLGAFGVLNGTLAIAGYAVAAIALLTGTMRYCPLWSVFKINTAKSPRQKAV